MSELQSVPTISDSDKLVINEWEFDNSDVINGMWSIAKVLERELLDPVIEDESITACLTIALVNLATQLKESR